MGKNIFHPGIEKSVRFNAPVHFKKTPQKKYPLKNSNKGRIIIHIMTNYI